MINKGRTRVLKSKGTKGIQMMTDIGEEPRIAQEGTDMIQIMRMIEVEEELRSNHGIHGMTRTLHPLIGEKIEDIKGGEQKGRVNVLQ